MRVLIKLQCCSPFERALCVRESSQIGNIDICRNHHSISMSFGRAMFADLVIVG